MRDRRDIEREIFEAREDLEDNLGRVAHRVREDLAVAARVRHAIDERLRASVRWLPLVMLSVIACGLTIAWLRRARS